MPCSLPLRNRGKLELDLVFLDTTNTYFECDVDESPSGLLKRGRSKDNHPELPLVSIAFAVTKQGIPIRCWTFSGNTSDQKIVDQVKSVNVKEVFHSSKIIIPPTEE